MQAKVKIQRNSLREKGQECRWAMMVSGSCPTCRAPWRRTSSLLDSTGSIAVRQLALNSRLCVSQQEVLTLLYSSALSTKENAINRDADHPRWLTDVMSNKDGIPYNLVNLARVTQLRIAVHRLAHSFPLWLARNWHCAHSTGGCCCCFFGVRS